MKMDSPLQLRRIFCAGVVQGTEPAGMEEFQFSQHSQREFLFVLRGESRYMLNRTVCELKPGDAVMIDSFVLHSTGYTARDHDLEHLWAWFPENLQSYCHPLRILDGDHQEPGRALVLPDELRRMIQYRWDLLRTFPNPSPELMDRLMRGPFQTLLDEVALHQKYDFPGLKSGRLSDFLKNYINSCFGRDCSLKRLSIVTGYCESHLSHAFQRETGTSIGCYLNRVRMEYTRAALEKGKKQKEIAAELGFSSPASFWNWFRKNAEKENVSAK